MACRARLRNISFKSVDVRILSIEHISRVLIRWDLSPTNQNLSSLVFYLDRSEDGADWTPIAGPIPSSSLHEVIDYTANLYDLQKVYYYRVRAVERSPDGTEELQEFISGAADTNGDVDLTALYIIEEHLFAYRYVYGVPVLIYKKRMDGEHCPECWDEVLKKVTKSNCKTCFGTGKMEGYYPPIEAWMKIDPPPSQSGVNEQGVIQIARTLAEFTNYPELRPSDLIFEPQYHYFWRVASAQGPEKNRAMILQQLQLTAVNRSDVEYRLEIPQDRVKILLAQLKERNQEREF